jgi:hypothetical protein
MADGGAAAEDRAGVRALMEGTVPRTGSRRIVIGREGFAQMIFNIGSVRPLYDEQLWTLVFRGQSGALSEDERLFVSFLQRLPLS